MEKIPLTRAGYDKLDAELKHLKTVERIIGYKPGTGGSSGVAFLKKALDLSFFPELFEVRTRIG